MSRSFWFFVFVAAFLVVGARCLSAFIGLDSGAPLGVVSLSQGSDASTGDDGLAIGAAADDDSDDSVDALLAPAHVSVEVAVAPALEFEKLSFAGQELWLSSHVRNLERPPRV